MDERTKAAWICCPMCDMDFEEQKDICPGRHECNEITLYLERMHKKDEQAREDATNGIVW